MSWFRRLWNRLCAWLARHGLLPRAGIFYIGGSDSLPPPLSREVEAEMLARLDEGDFEVRQILIEHNLRLVAYIARRFDNTGINIEDLISHRHHRSHQGHQHLPQRQEHQARDLCLALHRERNTHVSAQKRQSEGGGQL